MRVLIAEDDRALAMFLTRGLEADGHRVRCTGDGAEAVEAYREDVPDLTILDLNLPVKDGEQALAEMRAIDAQLPVLVLTGRQEVETRIRCLDLGADDLVIKPFSLHELRARCRALLRRKRDTKLTLKVGDLELDRLDHTARRAGEQISLTNKEFALLEHLVLHRGQCISRVELLDAVWNMEPAQTTNIVDVYVNYLRRKLQEATAALIAMDVNRLEELARCCVDLNRDLQGESGVERDLMGVLEEARGTESSRSEKCGASGGSTVNLPTDLECEMRLLGQVLYESRANLTVFSRLHRMRLNREFGMESRSKAEREADFGDN